MTLHGDLVSWYADDPDRACYTCGAPPTFRYGDGSPGYRCGPHPPVLGRSPATLESAGVRLEWTLEGRDPEIAERCALRLFEGARQAGRRDRQGRANLDSHRLGACGEVAFARLIGTGFRCHLNAFGRPDVGPYQVRTTLPQAYRLSLIVHFEDDDATPAVLMVGTPPRGPFRLAGWLRQTRLAKRTEYVRDPGRRRPSFFFPAAALESPLTIPELARLST